MPLLITYLWLSRDSELTKLPSSPFLWAQYKFIFIVNLILLMCFFPPTNKLQQLYLYYSPTNVKKQMWVTYAGPCRTCGLYAPTVDDDGGNVTLPDALQHYLVAEELFFKKSSHRVLLAERSNTNHSSWNTSKNAKKINKKKSLRICNHIFSCSRLFVL